MSDTSYNIICDGQCCADRPEDLDVCCEGGEGGMMLPMFGDAEQRWPKGLRGFLYLIGMLWCFLGVAIIADLFMGAIDEITSKIYVKVDSTGKRRIVRFWNPTVANLSLMALGSSAPEIMLNVMEIVLGNFYAGALGPSTIVGSAAFNLLVITAVCVVAITEGTKQVKELKVYAITATTSVLAYVWLLFILIFNSKDVITLAEALTTFGFFWVLLLLAYAADKNFFRAASEAVAPSPRPSKSNLQPEEKEEREKERERKRMSVAIDAAVRLAAPRVGAATSTRGAASTRKAASSRRSSTKEEGDEEGGVDGAAAPAAAGLAQSRFAGVARTKGLDGLDEAEKVSLVMEAMQQPTTAANHQRNSMAWLTGKKSAKPKFERVVAKQKSIAGAMHTLKAAASKANLNLAKNMAGPSSPSDIRSFGGNSSSSDGVAELRFKEEAVDVMEDAGTVVLVVSRSGRTDMEVSVEYKSHDISATGGKDYKPVEGTLVFGSGQREAEIEIVIIDDDRYEQAETFRVELSSPSELATLGKGGAQAMVTILNDDELKEQASKVLQMLGNRDKYEAVAAAWKEQFHEALYPCCGDEGETPTALQWGLHCTTVVWKVSFALVPPATLGGGWPAFCVSLGFIALMTIVVGDLAGLFGCVIGWPPAITAITFVALGTSMPDTFASKAAAQADETADNSVGNVTGSNCVNVFLGLGLPWTIGAAYWSCAGATARLEWAAKYAGNENIQAYILRGEAVFVVESGDLGLSVIVFCCTALVCLAVLALRRRLYGGELGGPYRPRMATAAVFVLLWGIYVLVSCLKTLGKIDFSM